jgi:hypothetical protein
VEEAVTAPPEIARALDAWDRATEQLLAIVQGIDGVRWDAPGPYPGWSNKDVLVHLATGYAVRIVILSAIAETGAPAEPPNPDAINAERVAEHKSTSIDVLVSVLRATRQQVRDIITRLRPEHLAVMIGPPDGRRSLGETLPHLSTHDLDHAADLQRTAGKRQ